MSNVKGLKEVLQKLNALDKDLVDQIDGITQASADKVERDAKRNVRVFDGALRSSIRAYKDGDLTWTIGANTDGKAPYAPYVEFGTGPQVKIEPEMAEIAARIRGRKGGGFREALDNITEWARKVGIKDYESAAYPILMSILKKGLRPRPFLYPAFKMERENYVKELEALLDRETKKI